MIRLSLASAAPPLARLTCRAPAINSVRKSILHPRPPFPIALRPQTHLTPTPPPGEALRECLQESECVMVQRNSASDCLRPPLADSLPEKCQQLKHGFGECKRGMIDMRKRFRGNMPVEYRTMQRADAGENYQLYAGRPALSTGARVTDGNDRGPRDWREVENEEYRAKLAAAAATETEGDRGGDRGGDREADSVRGKPIQASGQQQQSGAKKAWWWW